jgi:hypothetical protein
MLTAYVQSPLRAFSAREMTRPRPRPLTRCATCPYVDARLPGEISPALTGGSQAPTQLGHTESAMSQTKCPLCAAGRPLRRDL